MAMLGKNLTAKQQAIWDLKQAGKTRPQIVAELGISESTISKQLTYIRKKMGLNVALPKFTGGEPVHERPLPAVVTTSEMKLIDYAEIIASKVTKVNQTMHELGLPERMRMAHVRRLKVRHVGTVTPAKAIADEAMKTQIREKIALAFSYMDDKSMSEASFRDLSVGSTALIEKLQLLEGKPTQIISDLERKNLIELMPLLIAEAKRRGITVEGQVTEKVVSPA